jgi:pyruvate dehydrogenase E2 component (dihydrolipoamide acetyltransferase)
MCKEFKLPDLGEGIHEAAIVNVSVAEGDTVQADQTVMEVETDKAAVELPVPFAGKITKLNVKKGDTVVGSAADRR